MLFPPSGPGRVGAIPECRSRQRAGIRRVDRNRQPGLWHLPAGLAFESEQPVTEQRPDHRPDLGPPVRTERHFPEGNPETEEDRGERPVSYTHLTLPTNR